MNTEMMVKLETEQRAVDAEINAMLESMRRHAVPDAALIMVSGTMRAFLRDLAVFDVLGVSDVDDAAVTQTLGNMLYEAMRRRGPTNRREALLALSLLVDGMSQHVAKSIAETEFTAPPVN